MILSYLESIIVLIMFTIFTIKTMKSIYFYPILFLLAIPFNSFSQTVTTNERGERIVKFPDGSWRYFVPADTALLKMDHKTEKIDNPSSSDNAINVPTIKEKLINVFISRLQDEGNTLDKKLLDLTDERLKVQEDFKQAQSSVEQNQQALSILSNKLKIINQSISQVRQLKTENDAFLNELLRVRSLNSEAQAATLREYRINTIGVKDMNDVHKVVNEYFLNRKTELPELPDAVSDDIASQDAINNPQTDITSGRSKPTIINYSKQLLRDNCSLKKQGSTVNSSAISTIIDKELLFRYTPEKRAKYFAHKDLIQCFSFFSYQKGIYYLHLVFYIDSPRADLAFGGIKKNSQLTIRTLNGDLYAFFAYNNAREMSDPRSDKKIYHAIYQMSNRDARRLKKSPIDKVRVVWATGYEDYNIFKVDLLRKQLQCIDSFF